ncbi:sensor histidine kinase [Sphingomonas sp. LT1P40]|uniref:sensor histidine kinase n=1 Tax=Alteristakelama amylovorans TaxID=3096166 RepID=UPI002FC5AF14
MRFDDTLETVLAADISTAFGKASAWRQIVDLIGRRRVPADVRALSLLESIRANVPVAVRAASARALELAQPPVALVALCAADEIAVAAPVLHSARLNSGEWIELLPRLSSAGRAVLRARRDLPPGIERALESFGAVDFVIADGVVAAVADEPVALATVEEAAPINETVDKSDAMVAPEPVWIDWGDVIADSPEIPVPATAPVAIAEPVEPPVTGIDWTDVVAARSTGDIELPAEASVPEPRRHIRIRPVMEAVVDVVPTPVDVPPVVDFLPDAVEPAEIDTPVLAPPVSTFVSIGTAALGIPVVAAALQQAAHAPSDQDDSALPQSETGAEPLAATTLAAESELAHDSGMSGEETILADREDVAADAAARPAETAIAAAPEGPFEIAEVVARIDAFYTLRQDRPVALPMEARADGFRFETDEQGVIRWIDGVSRAPLIGLSLDMTALPDGSRVDGVAAGAFRRRAGFVDARLFVAGESDAAGDWRISANAAFDPATGRFSGYRGSARRPRVEESAATPVVPSSGAGDSLRQLMHELRTPTNAIAGFAELIEREMLGEVEPVYRERAAAIRDHARNLLAAIDDLDIAARIEASALRLYPGDVALRPMLARIAEDLGVLATMRGAWIALPIDNLTVTGDVRAVERLLSRMLATLISAAGEGERVAIRLAAESDDSIAIAFDRPTALAAYSGDAVYGIDDEGEDNALLGTGFALRLIRNLARELSGSFVIEADSFTIRLPAAVTKSLEQVR